MRVLAYKLDHTRDESQTTHRRQNCELSKLYSYILIDKSHTRLTYTIQTYKKTLLQDISIYHSGMEGFRAERDYNFYVEFAQVEVISYILKTIIQIIIYNSCLTQPLFVC